MRPSIVITGSAVAEREYTPPLANTDEIPEACRAIGRELARAGCDIVVFSSDDRYVEKDVVRGYLEAVDPARPGSVIVRTPYHREVDFDVPEHMRRFLQIRPDPTAEWEISYYRALFEADGLVVVGGGRATRIAGTLAVARSIPVIALASFGGGALSVWQHLDRYRNEVTDQDIHAMASAWTEDSAARLTESLVGQLARRRETVEKQARIAATTERSRAVNSLWAIALIIMAVATVWLGFRAQTTLAALGCLLAGPLFTAIGGALLRDASEDEQNGIWSAARGLGAGVLALFLYVGSQQLTDTEQLTPESARRLAWFLVPIGLAAGYTVDYVFARLTRVNVLSERPFQEAYESAGRRAE